MPKPAMVFQSKENPKLTISQPLRYTSTSHSVDKSQSLRTQGILAHIQKSEHLQIAVESLQDFRGLLQDFVLNTQHESTRMNWRWL